MRLALTTSTIALLAFATTAGATPLAGVGTYTGTAGFASAEGDLTNAPGNGAIVYVSTVGAGGFTGLNVGSEYNGSVLTTNTFSANAGEAFSYYFNYFTSDGAGYSDYAYAWLRDVNNSANDILIFTARTQASGDTVPGFDLPPIDSSVTLNPGSTAIIAVAPDWTTGLGFSSGECYMGVGEGCGYTGWIQSSYTFATAGTYAFEFGVVNWSDDGFDSALAISGVTVAGQEILPSVPLPAAGWMLLAGLGGLAGVARRRKTA